MSGKRRGPGRGNGAYHGGDLPDNIRRNAGNAYRDGDIRKGEGKRGANTLLEGGRTRSEWCRKGICSVREKETISAKKGSASQRKVVSSCLRRNKKRAFQREEGGGTNLRKGGDSLNCQITSRLGGKKRCTEGTSSYLLTNPCTQKQGRSAGGRPIRASKKNNRRSCRATGGRKTFGSSGRVVLGRTLSFEEKKTDTRSDAGRAVKAKGET